MTEMTESNIAPLPYRKLAGDLLAVFRQIDAMRNPEPLDVKYLTQAYPSKPRFQAVASLGRSFQHWGKGSLSFAEFNHVRVRCEAALADPPKAG